MQESQSKSAPEQQVAMTRSGATDWPVIVVATIFIAAACEALKLVAQQEGLHLKRKWGASFGSLGIFHPKETECGISSNQYCDFYRQVSFDWNHCLSCAEADCDVVGGPQAWPRPCCRRQQAPTSVQAREATLVILC